MTDKNTDAYGSPQVTDKRTAPPGILPKNAQAWVIAGLAAVMVAAMWLPGAKTPQNHPSAPPVTNTVIDPNAFRIQEYKKRLDEETRKLEAEQAQLVRREQALDGVSAGGPIHPRSVTSGNPETTSRPEGPGIRAEQEKPEHESRSDSNIALSLRKEPAAAKESAPASADELSKMLSFYSALATLQSPNARTSTTPPPATPPGVSPQAPSDNTTDNTKPIAKSERPGRASPSAERKEYRLMEGSV